MLSSSGSLFLNDVGHLVFFVCTILAVHFKDLIIRGKRLKVPLRDFVQTLCRPLIIKLPIGNLHFVVLRLAAWEILHGGLPIFVLESYCYWCGGSWDADWRMGSSLFRLIGLLNYSFWQEPCGSLSHFRLINFNFPVLKLIYWIVRVVGVFFSS